MGKSPGPLQGEADLEGPEKMVELGRFWGPELSGHLKHE